MTADSSSTSGGSTFGGSTFGGATLHVAEPQHFDQGALRMDGPVLRDLTIDRIRQAITRGGAASVGLATLIVGDDRASASYVGLKHRAAERAGLLPIGVVMSGDASQEDVCDAVRRLNDDERVQGILIQLPLPSPLDADSVIDLIEPDKDVDGLTATNLGRLVRGVGGLVPCTPLAVLRLLEGYGIALRGQRVVIVGRTPLVGIPLSLLLGSERIGADVTLCDAESRGVVELCRAADAVISDCCRPHMVTASWIRPGAAVVDVGVSRPGGHLVGDVDTEAVAAVAGALAPNPGGAGPMTVACLLENTLRAAALQGVLPLSI